MEEKEYPKKGVLGRDIKSSSTGVIPPRSIPVRKGSLSLFFSFSFARSISSPPPPLSMFLLVLLSSPLPRENPPPFVKGDPTKSPTSHTCVQKGWRGEGGGRESSGWWAAGTTRQTVHALFALYYGYCRKSPKGKYAKQRPPPPPPHYSPSYLSHFPLSFVYVRI